MQAGRKPGGDKAGVGPAPFGRRMAAKAASKSPGATKSRVEKEGGRDGRARAEPGAAKAATPRGAPGKEALAASRSPAATRSRSVGEEERTAYGEYPAAKATVLRGERDRARADAGSGVDRKGAADAEAATAGGGSWDGATSGKTTESRAGARATPGRRAGKSRRGTTAGEATGATDASHDGESTAKAGSIAARRGQERRATKQKGQVGRKRWMQR